MSNNIKSHFFSTKKETNKWLKDHDVKNYTINDDLSVDVNGGVDISHKNLKIIPVKFGNVAESFYCHNNKITTLVGAPESIGGDFSCINNKLINLIGSPKIINRAFYCQRNHLTSLAGSPEFVCGDFYCYDNSLTSLIGSPKTVGEDFICVYNQLTTLVGSPKSIGIHFWCHENPLISLLEINDCNFKGEIIFNIDETNFKQKELIKILKKYYNPKYENYTLTNDEFHNIIKSHIEKEKLLQKLNHSKTKNQIKASFI